MLLNKIFNIIQLKRKKVISGKNLQINGFLFLHGHGDFYMGRDVIITSSYNYNPTDGTPSTHLSTKQNGKIIIGNNVGMSNCAITASEMVKIEDDVLIGSGVVISDTDHHEILAADRKKNTGNIKSSPIIISRGAFIGMRSIILKGVTIGENSVIGAGAVVTCDIPKNELWAGNPAVFIKKLL